MKHILYLMLTLLDEHTILCILLFHECDLCVTMTQLLINHELRYMTSITAKSHGVN